jgi:Potential Queuosine, Q, salvage protein family
MDEETLAGILHPAPDAAPIPLFAERLANAREVGRVLLERYDGQFANALGAAGRDAVSLALLLARDFSSFADAADWNGQPVPFLKRAQICVADVHTAFRDTGLGAITGLDQLTAFADYKLPQLLRYQGVMLYAPELAAQVDAYQEIAAGSAAEIEIRAATIWAVESIRRALAERNVIRSASEIDYRLWSESQAPTPDMRPYHRTRTIYY